MNRTQFSFPVGKVDIKALYPMDMEEFLLAMGLYRQYLVVGGIPECAMQYADNTKAKSLKAYVETYQPDYCIKLSAKNFSFEDGKKTVPLYAAFCI